VTLESTVESVGADELGAHISSAGGVERAPARAREIGAASLQLFTKQANRWAEPEIPPERARAWEVARSEAGVVTAGAHDSYLINLASPDPVLWDRSLDSFTRELTRCADLGLAFLVTHPGNATDGDPVRGIEANARGITEALRAAPDGPTRVLLEITAGAGTSVGGSFEDLRAILDQIPSDLQPRMGVCFDTCHAFSAGYDLVGDYEGVWAAFEDTLGVSSLGLFHLNDSKHPLGSHKDRHEHIGKGTLGEAPFQKLMTDVRFAAVPKVLETPKGDDMVTLDRQNLARLRSYRQAGTGLLWMPE
jgi:deoxyribonuclease IV